MQRRDDDRVEAAEIAALVSLEGKRVLEVGCGKGRLTRLAAAHGSRVYAFDPSGENVAAARATLTSEQRDRGTDTCQAGMSVRCSQGGWVSVTRTAPKPRSGRETRM